MNKPLLLTNGETEEKCKSINFAGLIFKHPFYSSKKDNSTISSYFGFFTPYSKISIKRQVIDPLPLFTFDYCFYLDNHIPTEDSYYKYCRLPGADDSFRLLGPLACPMEIFIRGAVVSKTNKTMFDYVIWSNYKNQVSRKP